jgi:hypothetical protein
MWTSACGVAEEPVEHVLRCHQLHDHIVFAARRVEPVPKLTVQLLSEEVRKESPVAPGKYVGLIRGE